MKITSQSVRRNLARKRRRSKLIMGMVVCCTATVLFFQNCARDRFQSTTVNSSFVSQTPDIVQAQHVRLDSAKQKTIEIESTNTYSAETAADELLKTAEQNEIDSLNDSNACDIRTKPLAIEYTKCPHSADFQNRRNYKIYCGAGGVWTRVLLGTDISACMASYCDPAQKPIETEKTSCPAPNGNFKWATQTYLTSCTGSKWSRVKSTYDAGKCPLPRPKLRFTLNLAYPGVHGNQQGFDLYYPSDYQYRKYPIFVWQIQLTTLGGTAVFVPRLIITTRSEF